MKDWFEIKFWKVAIWILRKGYGGNCETCDLDDFDYNNPISEQVIAKGRCGSCRARECIIFIQDHISLIKM